MTYNSTHQRRIQAGLCVCGERPPLAGGIRCNQCKEARRIKQRQRYLKLKHAGICTSCGKAPARWSGCYCTKCNKRGNESGCRTRKKVKNMAFAAYGGYICNCCGETEPDFMEIDHVYNNGNEMRKTVHGHGTTFYKWLKRNGYPDGFQILCSNCNKGKHRNGGTCPHQAA